jgi:hypothetical protein
VQPKVEALPHVVNAGQLHDAPDPEQWTALAAGSSYDGPQSAQSLVFVTLWQAGSVKPFCSQALFDVQRMGWQFEPEGQVPLEVQSKRHAPAPEPLEHT